MSAIKNEEAALGTANLISTSNEDNTIRESIMQAVGAIVDINKDGGGHLFLLTPENVAIIERSKAKDGPTVIDLANYTKLDEYIADMVADHVRKKVEG